MNENINLVEILKDCPKGTKLYSPIYGDVEFVKIIEGVEYPINVGMPSRFSGCTEFLSFKSNGRIYRTGECLLFPSKNQRDWSKFVAPIPDKALVWCWEDGEEYGRVLVFYDAKNNKAFCTVNGDRTGDRCSNYELYKGEYPDWAKEAQKKLED